MLALPVFVGLGASLEPFCCGDRLRYQSLRHPGLQYRQLRRPARRQVVMGAETRAVMSAETAVEAGADEDCRAGCREVVAETGPAI